MHKKLYNIYKIFVQISQRKKSFRQNAQKKFFHFVHFTDCISLKKEYNGIQQIRKGHSEECKGDNYE